MPAALDQIPAFFWLAPVGGLAALAMAYVFHRSVLAKPPGDDEQVRIAAAVREGAMAYLASQYRTVGGVFLAIIAVLGLLSFGLGLQPRLSMIGVPLAGTLSGLCGWFGMRMATSASNRTAAAAKRSLNDGLTVAFRAGAVMGLNVVGFAILDCSFWYVVLVGFGEQLGLSTDLRDITTVMLSFAMGASTQALFARVGGGIYTKAADVGADLVGKVEAGIPEDDARNPATIADNVGDNVGDVAGMGADLYESYYGSILSTAALGAAAAFALPRLGQGGPETLAMRLALLPLALAGAGILASIVGILVVRTREGAGFADLLAALSKGIYTASGLIVVAAIALPYLVIGDGAGEAVAGVIAGAESYAGFRWWGVTVAIIAGLGAGLVIAKATEYYTSYEFKPTRGIAEKALTGPATVIIGGIAEGMKSTWAALLTIVAAIIVAFAACGGAHVFLLGLYGVAIAAVGMLATLGITLATDAYGPIADNAGGNAEMSGQPPSVRERTDMLDSLGNTTAAVGKGFAIGSAALTALALFASYVQIVQGQLTTQAAAYVEANPVEGTPDGPHAVYTGHGRFALVFPAHLGRGYESQVPYPRVVSGGLIKDRDQLLEGQARALRVGAVFVLDTATPDPAAFPEDLRVISAAPLEEGARPFRIVSTRSGTLRDVLEFYEITLLNPRVLGGLFIGVLLTFLFCALTMQAVGRAAYNMMNECRRQFAKMRDALRARGVAEREIADPLQWPKRIEFEGRMYPDYADCVAISTTGAQREMVVPSLLAILVPLGVGLVLDVPGVVGMLAGGLSSGFAVAILMANAGGAWDNAKKYIESFGKITAERLLGDPKVQDRLPPGVRGPLLARAEEMVRTGRGGAFIYGKGSDDHKAAVVGDTVGDPFKDTSGPSLNILIKLISIVSVVFAGLVVKYGPVVGSWIGLN